jgi:predicted RNA-binding protein YlxR (DUF448 family)
MKPRHVPIRTCAGCRQERPKREMVRVVRAADGIVAPDETGKRPGRGTYLCRSQRCWRTALKNGSLARALKCVIGVELRQELERLAVQFPEEDPTALLPAESAPGR